MAYFDMLNVSISWINKKENENIQIQINTKIKYEYPYNMHIYHTLKTMRVVINENIYMYNKNPEN